MQRSSVDLPDPDAPISAIARVLGDLEVDPAQHRALAVGLRDAADLEHRGHRRRFRSQRSSSRASGTVTQR